MIKKVLALCIILLLWGQNGIAQHDAVVEDIDGNTYQTVTIGNQVWMAENLKVTRFNDGTPIPMVTGDGDWWYSATPAYSWMGNNKEKYKDTYGALYNWYAVNTGKLCPAGWRVPTDADWAELIEFLGGDSIAGDKLKEAGTAHWRGPNNRSTNASGFTARPAGLRYFRGFYTTGVNGTWWSADEYTETDAWYRTIDYKFSRVDKYYYNKSTGFSVRCIKEE